MMRTPSIESARSNSLRGSMAAIERAAVQARKIAAQTHTAIVIERNGVLEHLQMAADGRIADAQTQTAADPKEH